MAIRTDASAGLLWLDRSEPDIGEAKAHVEHIAAAAARAADIIARVRGMAARRPPKSTLVAVNDVIGDAMQGAFIPLSPLWRRPRALLPQGCSRRRCYRLVRMCFGIQRSARAPFVAR